MAYQTINNIFLKNDSDLCASEAHGLATGLLCIENQTEAASWLSHLFADDIVLIEEDKTVLVSLFEQTRKLLNVEDDSFRLIKDVIIEKDKLASLRQKYSRDMQYPHLEFQ